jgi:hypothetical protein
LPPRSREARFAYMQELSKSPPDRVPFALLLANFNYLIFGFSQCPV